MQVGRIEVAITGNPTGLAASLATARGKLMAFGAAVRDHQAQWQSAALTVSAAGVAIAAGLGLAAKAAAEEQSILTDMNQVLGLTDAELKRMGKQIDVLARATGVLDQMLAPTLADIGRAGMKGAAGMEVLTAAAKAAVAGKADVQGLGNALVSLLRAYGLLSREAPAVMDTLYQGSLKGRMSLDEVAAAVKSLAPISAQLKVPIRDIVAALATATTVGYDAENTIMGIGRAMTNMTNPGKVLKDALHAAGYESGQALIQSRGFAGAIKFLTETAGDDEAAMIQMAGGVRGYKVLAALAADDSRLFAQKLLEVADSAGVVDEKFAKVQGTLANQWKRFRQGVTDAAEAIGGELVPVLSPALKLVTRLVGLIEKLPAPIRTAAVGLTALAGSVMLLAGGAVLMVLKVAQGVMAWRMVVGDVGLITGGMRALNAVLALLGIRQAAVTTTTVAATASLRAEAVAATGATVATGRLAAGALAAAAAETKLAGAATAATTAQSRLLAVLAVAGPWAIVAGLATSLIEIVWRMTDAWRDSAKAARDAGEAYKTAVSKKGAQLGGMPEPPEEMPLGETPEYRRVRRNQRMVYERWQAEGAPTKPYLAPNKLFADFLTEVNRVLREAGVEMVVTSARRSHEEQQRLYDRYVAGKGPYAAKPGTSPHEFGRAIDVAFRDATGKIVAAGTPMGLKFMEVVKPFADYFKLGWGGKWAGAKYEPWHFQMPGAVGLRAGAKAAGGRAMQPLGPLSAETREWVRLVELQAKSEAIQSKIEELKKTRAASKDAAVVANLNAQIAQAMERQHAIDLQISDIEDARQKREDASRATAEDRARVLQRELKGQIEAGRTDGDRRQAEYLYYTWLNRTIKGQEIARGKQKFDQGYLNELLGERNRMETEHGDRIKAATEEQKRQYADIATAMRGAEDAETAHYQLVVRTLEANLKEAGTWEQRQAAARELRGILAFTLADQEKAAASATRYSDEWVQASLAAGDMRAAIHDIDAMLAEPKPMLSDLAAMAAYIRAAFEALPQALEVIGAKTKSIRDSLAGGIIGATFGIAKPRAAGLETPAPSVRIPWAREAADKQRRMWEVQLLLISSDKERNRLHTLLLESYRAELAYLIAQGKAAGDDIEKLETVAKQIEAVQAKIEQHTGAIKSTWQQMWEDMREAAKRVLESIVQRFEDAIFNLIKGIGTFKDFWKALWDELLRIAIHYLILLLIKVLTKAGQIKAALSDALSIGGGGGGGLGGLLGGLLGRLLGFGSKKAPTATSAQTAAEQIAWTGAADLFADVGSKPFGQQASKQFVGATSKPFAQTAAQIFGPMAAAYLATTLGFGSRQGGLSGTLAGALMGWAVGGPIGAIIGGLGGLFKLWQHGGEVRARDVGVVGERGPELWVPRRAGYILPNAVLDRLPTAAPFGHGLAWAAAGAGGGGQTVRLEPGAINVTIYAQELNKRVVRNAGGMIADEMCRRLGWRDRRSGVG